MRRAHVGVLEIPVEVGGIDCVLVGLALGGLRQRRGPLLTEPGLVEVPVPSGLPAGGGEIVRPGVGGVISMGVDGVPGILDHVLAVTPAGEQVLGPVGVGGDPDRLALAHRVGIFVPLVGQGFGDGVDEGQEHGDVAGGAAGDESAEPVAGLGGPHVALRGGLRFPLPVRGRVDLEQRGVEDLHEPGPGEQLDLVVQQLVDDPGGEHVQMGRGPGDLAQPSRRTPRRPGPGPTAEAAGAARSGRRRSTLSRTGPRCGTPGPTRRCRSRRRAGSRRVRTAADAPSACRRRGARRGSAHRPRRRRPAACGSRAAGLRSRSRKPDRRGRARCRVRSPTDRRTCVLFYTRATSDGQEVSRDLRSVSGK